MRNMIWKSYSVEIEKGQNFDSSKYCSSSYNNVLQSKDSAIIKLIYEVEVVNERVYRYVDKEDIYSAIRSGKPVNLNRTYVKEFSYKEAVKCLKEDDDNRIIQNFTAKDAFFDGAVSFDGAIFGSDVVCFDEAHFGVGEVSFDGANFGDGNVSFVYATFSAGDISFSRARFGDSNVCFDNASFGNGDVRFNGTRFGAGDVTFFATEFGDGDVCFDRVQSGAGEIRFDKASFDAGNVSFYWAQFGAGDIKFDHAKFGDGDVRFDNVSFGGGDISFLGARADSVIFKESKLLSYFDLRFWKIKELLIQGCTIENILKIAGRPRCLSFFRTINLAHIAIKGTEKTNKGKEWRAVDAIRNSTRTVLIISRWKTDYNTDIEKAEQLRMLKENFRKIGQYEDEDCAYVEYMRCRRRDQWQRVWKKGEKGRVKNFISAILNGLVDLIGCYATKPTRVFTIMMAVIALFSGIYWLTGIDLGSHNWTAWSGSLYYSAITFLTIGYGDVFPATGATALCAGIEGFLGLFLMSYFTVAVVRKTLR